MLYEETSAFPCRALLQTDTVTSAKKLLPVENKSVREEGKRRWDVSEWQERARFRMGMPDAFDTMYDKADACGSTAGELGSVFPSHNCCMASLEQVADHSFSFGICCGWYSFLPPCYCRACEGDGAFILLV